MQTRRGIDRVVGFARSRADVLTLFAVTVVALLLTKPGVIAADTRQAALIDPDRFLARAWSLWDDSVHLGTVTHQNVGLTFPFGVFFWIGDHLGLPLWVVQRLWLGGLLFAAGMGVRYLLRGRGWAVTAAGVAAVAYALSPYTLQYGNRTSVLLVPFAGLPWFIAALDRSVRGGGWRMPALAGLVCLLCGGGNTTALLLMLVAGAWWLVVLLVGGTAPWRQLWGTVWRCSITCTGASVWWVAVLGAQSKYGLNILTYTESLQSVATTSSAAESLRGLGYWVFYGTEIDAPNVGASATYLVRPVGLVLSFTVALLSVAGAALARYRERTFVLLSVALGVCVASVTYPYGDSGPLGMLLHDHETNSLVLMFRSATRITPLVVLALSIGLGAGVQQARSWLADHRPAWGGRGRTFLAPVAAVLVLVANLPATVTGQRVDDAFAREEIPAWWSDAAAALDDGSLTRVLVLPGQPFASYRWGTTYEPVLPALMDRGSVAREQLPYGAEAGADLLAALDRRLHDGTADEDAIGAVARLLGAGAVLVSYDQRYERYLTVRPRWLAWLLDGPLAGLGAPTAYAPGYTNQADASRPLIDEADLQTTLPASPPAAIMVYPVQQPVPPLSLRSPGAMLLLVGDGEGVVDAASVGLLDEAAGLRQVAALSADELEAALRDGARVVITDTDRRRTRRWRAVSGNTGETLRDDQLPAPDSGGDAPLDVFPLQTSADQTVVRHVGATVDASTSGGPFFVLTPESRAANAFDGDPLTDWAVGPAASAMGEWIQVRAEAPVSPGRVRLLQRQVAPRFTTITSVRLVLDGARSVDVQLGDESLTSGQWVDVPGQFTTLRVEVTGTRLAEGYETFPDSPHGFAEIEVPGLTFTEVTRLPLRGLDEATESTPLAIVLSRLRSNPTDTSRDDEERRMVREFTLPAERSFEVSGQVRIAAGAPSSVIDALMGLPTGLDGVSASSELVGTRASRPAAAFDGDPLTAWQSAFDAVDGAWLQADSTAPRTVRSLLLTLLTDGLHSVPTSVTLDVDGTAVEVPLPEVAATSESGRTEVDVPLSEAVTGRTFRLTVSTATQATVREYVAGGPRVLPVGIAEWHLGLSPRPSVSLDSSCRDDLLAVDGRSVAVRVFGTTAELLEGRAVSLQACDPVDLSTGTHLLETSTGDEAGLVIDRLLLDSGDAPAADQIVAPDALRRVSGTEWSAEIGESEQAQVVVLAQSYSEGWHASLDGDDLGTPFLADGYANGWTVPAGATTRQLRITWQPQTNVTRGLWVSGVCGVVCIGLLSFGRRRPLSAPASHAGAGISTRWRVGAPLMMGVVGLAMFGPLGLLLAAATALAVRGRRAADLTVYAGVALIALSFGLVLLGHARDRQPVGYGWTLRFEDSHWLALLGSVLLACGALWRPSATQVAPAVNEEGGARESS